MKQKAVKNKKPSSIGVQFAIILTVIWGLLFVLISVYGSLTRKTLVSEIQSTNSSMLSLYCEQLDTLCTEVNRSLANLYLSLEDSDPEAAESEIPSLLSTNVLLFDNQFSFYYMDIDSGSTVLGTASNITLEERNAVGIFLDEIPYLTMTDSWQLVKIEGSYYITKFYRSGTRYIGSWISLENALNLYSDNRFESGSTLLFLSSLGNPLTHPALADELGDRFTDTRYMNRKYMTLTGNVLNGQAQLCLLIPYRVVLKGLNFINWIRYLILVFFVLCLGIMIYYLNRLVFKPLRELERAMKEVESGNYKVQIANVNDARELAAVNGAFNSMTSEIDHLKTDIYEKEIASQQLELEKLQLQVKPHFYLNCLNIIFNLSQAKDYTLIQGMCLAQIKYFRYMMKSSFSFVTIQEEFDHIQNYLHIQQLRYPGRFDIAMDLQTEEGDLLIPPLTLHVFAENVVKHAIADGPLKFSVQVKPADEDYICIHLEDSGPGFTEEILKKLQAGESLTDENGEHIGISNTIKRIQLSYEGDASFAFRNAEPHGAVIEITIPRRKNSPDAEGGTNEPADH